MSNGFSIGDELSDFVNDASSHFQYSELKKTWPKYFIIGTLVVGSSVLSLIKGCERESKEVVQSSSQADSLYSSKDTRNAYRLKAADLNGAYNKNFEK